MNYLQILKEKHQSETKPSDAQLKRMVENAKIDSATEMATLVKVENDAKNEYQDALESDALNFSVIRRLKASIEKAGKEIVAQKELHEELFGNG